MIDHKTGKRVVVQIDPDAGPYFKIYTREQADELEDLFGDKYDILFEMKYPEDVKEDGGQEFYFGNLADPIKLQKIIDEII
ncbi:hypothetical protein [Kiloniella majae]|uniref:hypothetical protein n=1 Tax=Kiloniella majae TaxID=1938558 RepID=UPI000A2771DC|nr:hypothetical protein [Kiloniella majae]